MVHGVRHWALRHGVTVNNTFEHASSIVNKKVHRAKHREITSVKRSSSFLESGVYHNAYRNSTQQQ
ncbi:hypothetical protein OK016_07945 [Vibrio chagasii]|nr:hypothetical protein [Vibrio chagasii]